MRRFAAPMALAAALGVSGWSQVVVTCPRAPAPPVLDGNVTPEEWVSAGRMGPFVLLHGEGLPREATDVRVMYDDEALYVAATLYDSDTDNLRAEVTETDGEVYRDDCFELFIDALGTGESYVHLVINPRGVQFDEVDHDRATAVVWNAGVAVREEDWSVELSVPFTGGRPPAEGTVWHVGAARHEARLEEYSSWNGFAEGFHEPARFGELKFGGPQVSFKLADPGAMKLGLNTALLLADNATSGALPFKANVRVLGRHRSGHFFRSVKLTALPGARTPARLPYEVTQDGSGSVMLSVTDARGQVIYRTAPVALHIPAVAGELFAVEAVLAGANVEWARLPDSEAKSRLRDDLNALSDEWRELSRLVEKRTTLDPVQLRELQTALRALHGRVQSTQVRLRAAAQGGGEVGSFIAVPTDALTKVFPDQAPMPSSAAEVRLEVCRNETESFQIAVTPLTDGVAKLSVQVSDLAGSSARIPAHRVQVRLVGNVPAADHLTPGAGKRLWPDILTPALSTAQPIEVPPDETRALWVSVSVPAEAVPGEYHGEVRLSDAGGSTARIPVQVVVHHAVLPSPRDYHLWVGFWQAPRQIARQYGLEPWSEQHWDRLRVYLSDMAAHGQNLATATRDLVEWRVDENGKPTFSYTLLDRYVELCREVGIDEGIEYYSMFNGGGDSSVAWADANGDAHSEKANPGDERFDTLWSAFLSDFARHLEEKGWLSNVYICPTDEPRDGRGVPTLERFAHCAALVHAASPGLKVTVALDSLDSARTLAPCTDRMVFKLRDDVYNRELAASKRAEGGRAEAYICCHPQRPNTFITSPNIDSRVIGWLLFREQLQGLLRWSYERWPADPMGQPEGDGRYAAGDLFIVYPGPDGPYGTPRWELLRDGFEDYELLYLLDEAVTQTRAAGKTADADAGQEALNEAIVRVTGEGTGLAEFTDDPHELHLARVKLLTTLDWLGRG